MQVFPPDISDLNDWVVNNFPEAREAMHYLHVGVQYDAYLAIWRAKGSPSLDESFAPDKLAARLPSQEPMIGYEV